jgi:polyhydroxyalkanoate synthesis regulator phasin
MKTVLVIIVLIVITIGAGYFGLPVLIKKETGALKSDVQDIKQRLQKIEEESKAAPLKSDANVREIIKSVNAIYHKMNSLESSLNKDISANNEAIKDQKVAIEGALRKQSEAIDKMNKDVNARTQKIMFDARMANIRGHILKARVEIVAKNVGTAKNELDLVDEAFERAKTSASDENKKTIEELQITLKKARGEIDSDLPAALNKIDLLWYEMGKMMRKT